ncbi:hypothetical protein [Arthrobacter oryzae]|nr:hypothetical protein [Arthrobacter oryzae]WLQ08709.1 hypothetical protein Q8Z05_12865 [Arthrobacter oryzae]
MYVGWWLIQLGAGSLAGSSWALAGAAGRAAGFLWLELTRRRRTPPQAP